MASSCTKCSAIFHDHLKALNVDFDEHVSINSILLAAVLHCHLSRAEEIGLPGNVSDFWALQRNPDRASDPEGLQEAGLLLQEEPREAGPQQQGVLDHSEREFPAYMNASFLPEGQSLPRTLQLELSMCCVSNSGSVVPTVISSLLSCSSFHNLTCNSIISANA